MKGGLAFIDRPTYRLGCDQSPAGPSSWCFWFGRCYDDLESMGVQGAADLPGHRAATSNGYAK